MNSSCGGLRIGQAVRQKTSQECFVPDCCWEIAFIREMTQHGLFFAGSAWDSFFTTLWVAALSLAIVPVLVLYLVFSRQLIRGITAGAVK